jgi:hypothetical protein
LIGNQLLILAAGKATTAEKPQDEDDDDDKEQKDENGEADVDVGDEQTTTVVGVTEEFEDSYIDDNVQANIAAMRIQAVQRGRCATPPKADFLRLVILLRGLLGTRLTKTAVGWHAVVKRARMRKPRKLQRPSLV